MNPKQGSRTKTYHVWLAPCLVTQWYLGWLLLGQPWLSQEGLGWPQSDALFSFPPDPPHSFGLHHCHALGQPQQLLQSVDLHALHRPPLPRTCTALPLLLCSLPEGQPAWRDKHQQEKQLIHFCPESSQLQPEELLSAILGMSHRPGLPGQPLGCVASSLPTGGCAWNCVRCLLVCIPPLLGLARVCVLF